MATPESGGHPLGPGSAGISFEGDDVFDAEVGKPPAADGLVRRTAGLSARLDRINWDFVERPAAPALEGVHPYPAKFNRGSNIMMRAAAAVASLGLLTTSVEAEESNPAWHYCGPSAAWLRAHHQEYQYGRHWVKDHCVPRPAPKASGPSKRLVPPQHRSRMSPVSTALYPVPETPSAILHTLGEYISSEFPDLLIGQNTGLSLSRARGNGAIIGGFLGNEQTRTDEEQTNQTDDCPYSCDPVKAMGGPKLSRPDVALGSLVLFLASMYLSDRGLDRRRFGVQHIGCWVLAVIGGCFFILAVLPIVLKVMWPVI